MACEYCSTTTGWNQSHITTQLASSSERGTWQEESSSINNKCNHSIIFSADCNSFFLVAEAAFFIEINRNYNNMCTSTQQLNASNHHRHHTNSINFESSPFPALRKRRVRFRDESCPNSQVPQPPTAKRCRMDNNSSSIASTVLNHDELLACKPDLWVGREDARRIRREARQQAHILRKMDAFMMGRGQGHLSFSETYANVYAVCHVGGNGTLIAPEILTFMSLGEGRGLEDQTSPRIAIERRVRRQKTIKMVVQAHARWTGEPHKVRQVSETLSAPSRRLAEALGYVDASASILACQESSSQDEVTLATTTTTPTAKANDLMEVFDHENAGMHGLDAAIVSFDCPAPRGPVVATAAAS